MMQSQTKPLPTGLQLTPLDPDFRQCPHKYLDQLRAEDPLHRDTELGRLFPTRFEDVKAVVSDRSLSVDPRKAPPQSYYRRTVMGNAPIQAFEPTMVHLDDPDHKRIRSLVARAFSHRSVEEFRPRIREIAVCLLDKLTGRDPFDVILEYANPLPIIVIAEMLGVDARDIEQFKSWSDARAQIFNPARTPEETEMLASAQQGLSDYFMRAIETRRHSRGTDLISTLVAAEGSGERLSEREIVLTCNLLLVAGNLTTTDLIGNGVLALLSHPDQLRKLRENPALIDNTVEETLRYDPPVAQTNRIALEPTVIGGTTVQAGEAITAPLLAAGRDPSRHSDPHHFDIERADTTHLAFGGGAHYCIGASLARAEAQIALSLLLERFPYFQLDARHAVERKTVPVFNGLKALWLRTT